MSRTKGKILVIRGGAIGDFILTLPVLTALRARFPDTHLEVLGYPHIAQLALAGGLADAVRSIEAGPLAGFFARRGTLDQSLQEYFAAFNIIISFLYDPDEIFQENVARCSKAQFIIGPHRPNEKATLHATETFLRPLERLAIFAADRVPRLAMARPVVAPGATEPARRLALHPGSGSDRKNWPEAHWTRLLRRLVGETPFPLLLVGGEAEGDRLDRLAGVVPRERLTLARSVQLPELAARLAACSGFIGHDSGITHLAAALGLPTLVLWGPAAEAVWRPLGDNVRLLAHKEGLAALPVEIAWHALMGVVRPTDTFP